MTTQSPLSSNWSSPSFLIPCCSNLMYFPSEARFWQYSQMTQGLSRPRGAWPHRKKLSTYSSCVLWMGGGAWDAVRFPFSANPRPAACGPRCLGRVLHREASSRGCTENPELENRNLKIFQFEVLKTLSWYWSHILLTYQTPEIVLIVSQAPCCIYKQLQHS